MSSTSALENNEDLENITFVRMEDVQPDRNSELYEVLSKPPCIMNRVIDHDYFSVVNDDDSNIGSMVSINSEEVEEYNEKSVMKQTMQCVKGNQGSWPTLEILPGGVIKHSEKFISSLQQNGEKEPEARDLMYACAKCSQRFKFLFNLVKHVKLHEDEKKLNSSRSSVGKKVSSNNSEKTYIITKRKKTIKHKTKCKTAKK